MVLACFIVLALKSCLACLTCDSEVIWLCEVMVAESQAKSLSRVKAVEPFLNLVISVMACYGTL